MRQSSLFAVIALVLAALFATMLAPQPRSAEAQSSSPEMLATGHFSVASVATIITGTTGLNIKVTKVYVTSESAGLVTFHDGTSGSDATRVGLLNFYLVANTPTEIPAALLSRVKTATTGNAIKCVGPGVLHYAINYTN